MIQENETYVVLYSAVHTIHNPVQNAFRSQFIVYNKVVPMLIVCGEQYGGVNVD